MILRLMYNLGIFLLGFIFRLASLFSSKAALWVRGRKNWQQSIPAGLEGCVWMHCASLGEFEQGRPILETFRREYPSRKIVLSFFSPSGYEVRKNTPLADLVIYLPLDTRKNARIFLKLLQPSMAVFVRYDLWIHFLRQLKTQQVPTYLIAAVFRENHWLLKPWAAPFRGVLDSFSVIFHQDKGSMEVLKKYRQGEDIIAGDPRVDRVIQLPKEPLEPSWLETWKNGQPCVVLGSLWEKDWETVSGWIQKMPGVKFIIAPHEIHELQLKSWMHVLGEKTWRFSQGPAPAASTVLFLDKIGLLNKVYRLADWAFVGGGFDAGIHNTLEPAVYGIPIVFGPRYQRFPEALWWIDQGVGFSVKDKSSFEIIADKIHLNNELKEMSSRAATVFFSTRSGATRIFFHKIVKNTDF